MKRRVIRTLLCLYFGIILTVGMISPCLAASSDVGNISQNPRVLFLGSYNYE